jgi:hypothetical protein
MITSVSFMAVGKGGTTVPAEREKGQEMHDQLTRLEVWRHHREELLREAEHSRLAREARRRRREAGREWKINLGGWTLKLRRIPDYETSQAAKG